MARTRKAGPWGRLALTSLAGREPIDIVRFGNLGPGAGPGVLLRFADLAESIPAANMGAGITRSLGPDVIIAHMRSESR